MNKEIKIVFLRGVYWWQNQKNKLFNEKKSLLRTFSERWSSYSSWKPKFCHSNVINKLSICQFKGVSCTAAAVCYRDFMNYSGGGRAVKN